MGYKIKIFSLVLIAGIASSSMVHGSMPANFILGVFSQEIEAETKISGSGHIFKTPTLKKSFFCFAHKVGAWVGHLNKSPRLNLSFSLLHLFLIHIISHFITINAP